MWDTDTSAPSALLYLICSSSSRLLAAHLGSNFHAVNCTATFGLTSDKKKTR
jgi:hypothetical protein